VIAGVLAHNLKVQDAGEFPFKINAKPAFCLPVGGEDNAMLEEPAMAA